MVKLTLVGRVSDGLPLAQHPILYVNDEHSINTISSYKQQAEFLLKEISRGGGDFPNSSKISIFLYPHCFNSMVENGICFMVLCDSSYPRKLAFCYLQDLKREFDKFDVGRLKDRVLRPYSFTRFEGVIGSIGKKYIDTRTQANLSKLNSDSALDLEVASESFSQIVKRRRRFDMLERMSVAHLNASPVWSSKRLEVIALKWIPIGLVFAVTSILIWTSTAYITEMFRSLVRSLGET